MRLYGEKLSGELVITGLDKLSEGLKEGDSFELHVVKTKDIRSSQMNNLYWWWMGMLSEHSGYTKKELHEYFKSEFLCETVDEGKVLTLDCKSTSDLNIKDFSKYLENVARSAAQNFSFILPDPDSLV